MIELKWTRKIYGKKKNNLVTLNVYLRIPAGVVMADLQIDMCTQFLAYRPQQGQVCGFFGQVHSELKQKASWYNPREKNRFISGCSERWKRVWACREKYQRGELKNRSMVKRELLAENVNRAKKFVRRQAYCQSWITFAGIPEIWMAKNWRRRLENCYSIQQTESAAHEYRDARHCLAQKMWLSNPDQKTAKLKSSNTEIRDGRWYSCSVACPIAKKNFWFTVLVFVKKRSTPISNWTIRT